MTIDGSVESRAPVLVLIQKAASKSPADTVCTSIDMLWQQDGLRHSSLLWRIVSLV